MGIALVTGAASGLELADVRRTGGHRAAAPAYLYRHHHLFIRTLPETVARTTAQREHQG